MRAAMKLAASACLLFGLGALLSCDLIGRLVGRDQLEGVERDNPVDPGAGDHLGTGIQPADAATVSDTTPLFSWQPFAGVTSYEIQVSGAEDFSGPLVEQGAGIEDTRYQLASVLQDHQQCFWRLRPFYADGSSAGWSQVWKFTVHLPVPSLTAPLQGASVDTPLPVVSWQTLTEAAQYTVQVSETLDFSALAAEAVVEAADHCKLAILLADGGLYYWRARIIDANGVAGDWSDPSAFSVRFPKPAAPSPPTGDYVSDKTPLLRWGAVPDASGYQLQLNDSEDFSGSLLFDENVLAGPLHTVPSALAIHQPYYWRVRALYGPDASGPWGDPWSFETDGTIWKCGIGDYSSFPAIAPDGTVYLSHGSFLFAVSHEGTKMWWLDIKGSDGGPVAGADGVVYVKGYGFVQAINPDRTEKWRYILGSSRSGAPAMAADGTIYAASDSRLVALDPTGIEKWRLPILFIDDVVIDAFGTIYACDGDDLYALNPDGTERWVQRVAILWEAAIAVDSQGIVYIPAIHGKLVAVNPDGSKRWEFQSPLSEEYKASPAIAPDGTVYIEAKDTLFAINPDGTERWRRQFAGTLSTVPLLGKDGTIYISARSPVADGLHSLIALGADGSVLWRVNRRGPSSFGTPVMAADGTIYASFGLDLYAIETFSPGPAASGWPMYRHDPQHSGRAGP